MPLIETPWYELWQGQEQVEPVGAVFTRPEIVDLILDLAGYTVQSGRRLAELRVLEPGCGDGAFTSRIIDRMIASERQHGEADFWEDPILDDALRAVDLDARAIEASRIGITTKLTTLGCPQPRAEHLAQVWTVHTDFLLQGWETKFDLVVGNPPYVRIEDLPRTILLHYRAKYTTLTDRADLYVAFFQRGLQLLTEQGGTLAFICANRFTKNKYGRALRELIDQHYHVRYYFNLEHTQPFEQEVSAYPAIIVLDRNQGEPTRAATLTDLDDETLDTVRHEATAPAEHCKRLAFFDAWFRNGAPWLTTRIDHQQLLDRLNTPFPALEQSASNTKVGIGVATGADRVFILKQKHPEIEGDRQLPLLMSRDITNQGINWSGHYILNPFDKKDDGSLVDLSEYPNLTLYFDGHCAHLLSRHIAKKNPAIWYRTIDRIWPALQHQPKLLIPDIQGVPDIGFDEGHYYPHHNLYWITSDSWNLQALKAILRSTIVLTQVQAYSVQMRGGHLRYQAQTLRKVRLPYLAALSATVIEQLVKVAESEDQEAIDSAANEAFGVEL